MLSGRTGEATAAYGTLFGEHPVAGTPKPTVPEIARPAVERGSEYLYTGKRLDAETGHYDYGFRDYAPRLARFTTVDPVRDGPNWYAYVENDPVNFVDPLGLEASDAQSAGIGSVAEPFVGSSVAPYMETAGSVATAAGVTVNSAEFVGRRAAQLNTSRTLRNSSGQLMRNTGELARRVGVRNFA